MAKKKTNHGKPPKGALPNSFLINGEQYIVQSVNTKTDEVVLMRQTFHSFKLKELKEKLKHHGVIK